MLDAEHSKLISLTGSLQDVEMHFNIKLKYLKEEGNKYKIEFLEEQLQKIKEVIRKLDAMTSKDQNRREKERQKRFDNRLKY